MFQAILFLGETSVLYPIALVFSLVLYILWGFSLAQLKLIRQLKQQLKILHREKEAIRKEFATLQAEENEAVNG